MLKLLLLLCLTGMPLPSFPAEHVTAAQLKAFLSTARDLPDADLARQLSKLQLTERLSPTMLAKCEADLPGVGATQQLLALAGVAAFLDLPAAEIPATPMPDVSAQRQILALTVNYVTRTVHLLPNFYANRTTTHYQGGTDKPWTFAGKSLVKVLYRKGDEVLDSRGVQSGGVSEGLTTSGEFGPILGTVLLDAAQSHLAWSHWERGPSEDGQAAVFRFTVDAAKSHYQLTYCCIERYGSGAVPIQATFGYRGEITVDAATGTVLRVVLRADLKPGDPFTRADIFVEYGPVEIGGKIYICPVKSGAYSVPGWREVGTWLNDAVFDQYHVFRGEAHIVGGDN